jgi:hypothetical protein
LSESGLAGLKDYRDWLVRLHLRLFYFNIKNVVSEVLVFTLEVIDFQNTTIR